MKNIILVAILAIVFSLTACKKSGNEESEKIIPQNETHQNTELYACSMHPEIHGEKGDKCSECGMELTEPVASSVAIDAEKVIEKATASKLTTTVILEEYLKLKNALAKDDAKMAATIGKDLSNALTKTNQSGVEAARQKETTTIITSAKTSADEIATSGANIDKQRNSFVNLSMQVTYLIQMFGSDKKVYQEFCPMYANGKTGYWINESKEIINPYYGAEMLNCGGVIRPL